MEHLTDEEFENAVSDALIGIPEVFLDALDNIAITVADEPTSEEIKSLDGDGGNAGTQEHGELLGLYQGVPITERDFSDPDGEIPDVITIFKGPHERCFPTKEAMISQIHKTVIHEIGHYFGLDDARLHEMGY